MEGNEGGWSKQVASSSFYIVPPPYVFDKTPSQFLHICGQLFRGLSNIEAMSPVTNRMLNARREKDCVGITHERKYFHSEGSFVKRSLRPSEWQHNPFAGTLSIPRFGHERILNEAAALRFIAEKTDIPVPKLYGCFEDDQAVYLVTKYIEGVKMAELQPEQRKTIELELDGYVDTPRNLKSDVWGGPSGIVSFLFLQRLRG